MDQKNDTTLANDLLDFIILVRNALSGPMRSNLKDLSLLQLIVLTILKVYGRLNMTQIAQQLSISNQQLTKLVASLVEKGYVKKNPDPTNRRASLVTLTPSGIEFLKEFKVACTTDVQPILVNVTPEQSKQWKATMREMRDAFMPSISEK